MFTELLASGSGGGDTLTLDTFAIASVSSTTTYTFTKDYKYVILIDGTSVTPSSTWYENNIRVNESIKSGMQGGYIRSSKVGGTYALYAMIGDIKNGDALSVVSGSYNFLLIGLV